jgi:protein SCO1
LGPDLQGLTARRDRAWVMRYLGEPEKMRANNDPIAVELAKQYKVLMPNLSLTHQEVDDLVAYLEAKTGMAAAPAAPKAAAPAAAADGERSAADTHHDNHHHESGVDK